MKTLLVFLLAFMPSFEIVAQSHAIKNQCPCAHERIERAQKRARWMWENGWVLQIKCRRQSFFFRVNLPDSKDGILLTRDTPFKKTVKISYRDHHSFGVDLGDGTTVYYNFNSQKWSEPSRPLSPGEIRPGEYRE